MWSHNYSVLPLDAAKENETEIFEITTLNMKIKKFSQTFQAKFPKIQGPNSANFEAQVKVN